MVTGAALRKAIFLDRDGVIVVPMFRNGRSYAPTLMRDFSIYPDALLSLNRLKEAGYLLIVVTNQPDVGAGVTSYQILEEMHATLRQALPVDDIKVCVHTAGENCDCRKPKPGLLLQAAAMANIDLARSVMVGDRASDTAAGAAAGCRTAFLDLSYEAELPPTDADFTGSSLSEITTWILSSEMTEAR